MSISFFGFDTAISGLSANQKALEVTGHNVANLGTPGYSRQNAIMASSATKIYGNWHVEMGVDIQQIRQIRHTFNDNIYRNESNNLGYWESRYKAVTDLESILGEPMQQGFQVALNNFWDAFQELSKAPESLTIRALVKQRADSLVNYLNQVGSQINKLQNDLNTEIKARIDEVNDITEKLAALNVKIMSAEAAGNLPNDYYDQRNELCDRLSKLVKVETWETRDGSMDILVGGYFLVSKGEQKRLVAAPNEALSHFYTPMVEYTEGNIPIDVGQGIIKGLMEARGEVSGAKGSYDNGSPNITGDITIAVDVSNTSADYLSNVKANIATLVEDLKVRGIDYNLRLVTFGGDEPVTNANFGKNADALIAAIPDTPNAGTSNDFADVVNAVNSNSYAEGANKYLMVFTGESINGNGEIADDITISEYISILNKNGIAVSVATDPIYHNEGDAGERGWNIIAERTGGKLYSSTADTDFDILVKSISSDINKDINTKIASVPDNLNIISSVRKQLNALINIMAREVNRLHLSGKTLTGSDGGFFFEPIEPNLPIELGNIKISDALRDLNNIAASSSDANGDNKIALAIANLRNSNLMTGNKKILSLDTYYQNIIMDLGNKGYEAGTMAESYRNLVTQADANRQSVMGVSLDEEMTNMIKYKFAYNANAKVIDAVNQMLETIMFRMGAS
ncbi:MAG TPA: flagellar hook-associated protein FlgK [Clostridiaceae bacterium]|jgi:flagellar hook-associated protein 1 FlgK|nr:flagellar hook-associated protein FlgK [Clostridiaceae bacterium]